MKSFHKAELPLDMIGKIVIALAGISVGVSVLLNFLGGIEPEHQIRQIIETTEYPVCPGFEGEELRFEDFQIVMYGFYRGNCEESLEAVSGFNLPKDRLEEFLKEMEIKDINDKPLVLYGYNDCGDEDIFEGFVFENDEKIVISSGEEIEIEKKGGTVHICQK